MKETFNHRQRSHSPLRKTKISRDVALYQCQEKRCLVEYSLLQSKLCAVMGDISCVQFLLDLVNAETRGVVSKKQCKGFSV